MLFGDVPRRQTRCAVNRKPYELPGSRSDFRILKSPLAGSLQKIRVRKTQKLQRGVSCALIVHEPGDENQRRWKIISCDRVSGSDLEVFLGTDFGKERGEVKAPIL